MNIIPSVAPRRSWTFVDRLQHLILPELIGEHPNLAGVLDALPHAVTVDVSATRGCTVAEGSNVAMTVTEMWRQARLPFDAVVVTSEDDVALFVVSGAGEPRVAVLFMDDGAGSVYCANVFLQHGEVLAAQTQVGTAFLTDPLLVVAGRLVPFLPVNLGFRWKKTGPKSYRVEPPK